MSTTRAGYRGYVTCRPFGGLYIPVSMQALMMRDYCTRNGYMYKLHTTENIFPNSYMILEGMIQELDRYEGLLVTSMYMMPKRAERRRSIYDEVLGNGASLHFVLEDFVIRTLDDIEPVEEILMIQNVLPRSPSLGGDRDAVVAEDQ